MKILVSGSSGLIGSALVEALQRDGHSVHRLLRKQPPPDSGDVFWDPAAGRLDAAALAPFDAVIHLAGENIAAGRWTPTRKRSIRDSRVRSTRLLANALAQLPAASSRVLICASAIGIYGSRGDEPLTEDCPPGTGFLAEVGREWEAAAESARNHGIRVVHLRFGMVLSPRGGALAKMLPPFRLGLGGPLGSGRQFMSWITLRDSIRVIQFALTTPALSGPVNATSPNPVTNLEFTRSLAAAVHRPALIPVPSCALRLLFGEMADALLLASARVIPQKLLNAGFQFQDPELPAALHHLLASSAPCPSPRNAP